MIRDFSCQPGSSVDTARRKGCWGAGPLGSYGFTLIELVIGIALVAVMIALALPSINTWRDGVNYRQSAKSIESALRETRSKAVASNRQYMLAFKPDSNSYQIFQGDRSYNTSSSGFSPVPAGRFTANAPVQLRTGETGGSNADAYVQFYPNGTAAFLAPDKTVSDSNLSVNDSKGTGQKYLISVTTTGRVNVTKKY